MDTDSELICRVAGREDGEALANLFRRHHPSVLRVTQALLRHGADAEDAAQETFLRAMQEAHGFRDQGSVRGWLLRIAANLSRDRLRRPLAPGLDAGGESLADREPEPVAAAAAKEWERLLLRAFLDLPAEFREPLTLRYWDGRSLTEIAARLKVPRSTADLRCRQGLDLLRHRLDPPAWKALPLFLGTVPGLSAKIAAAAAASPLLTAGVALMTTKNAVAAAVLLAVAGVGWSLRDPAPGDAADGGAASSIASGDAGRRTSPPGKVAPAAPPPSTAPGTILARPFAGDAEPPPPPGAWRVRGRVVAAAGGTLPAKTTVQARRYDGWWDEVFEHRGEPEFESEVPVGEDGRFFWDLPAPEREVTVLVRASAPGWFEADADRLVLRGDPPPNDLELRLRPLDIVIEGRVTRQDGTPIPHPKVRWWRRDETGDEDGFYRLRAAAFGSEVRITVRAAGCAPVPLSAASPGPGGTVRLDAVLDPGAVVSGRVLDGEGRPVPGAAIECYDGDPPHGVADAAGSYRMGGLPRGRPSGFSVSAPGFLTQGVGFPEIPEGEKHQDVVLVRAVPVSGLVVDEQGAPVEGARVGLGPGFGMSGTLKTISGRDGRFHFSAMPPGDVALHAVKSGFVQAELELVRKEDPAPVADARIVLQKGITLRARLIDGEGAPVAGASIAPKRRGWYLEARARSGDDGGFELPDLEGPEVPLEIYGRGLVRLHTTVRPGPDPAIITVERHGILAGTVVDAATGAPVPRFRIRFVTPTLEPGDHQVTGYGADVALRGRWFAAADGTWTIDNEELKPGAVAGIEVSGEGYALGFAPRVIASRKPDPGASVVRLVKAASITGTVLDAATRQPVGGARVRWAAAGAAGAGGYDREHETVATRRTGDGGTFRFDDVASGAVVLEIVPPGRPPHRDGPFDVSGPGAQVTRTIFLGRGATIEGVVEDGRGRLVAGAELRLDPDGDRSQPALQSQETHSGEGGTFRFEGVGAGRWVLIRHHRQGRFSIGLHSMEIDVPAEGTVRVRFRPEGAARVAVSVAGADPLPDGLIVQAIPIAPKDRSGPPRKGQAAPVLAGRAVFEALPEGRWMLHAHVLGIWDDREPSGNTEIELAPGADRTVEVRLGR